MKLNTILLFYAIFFFSIPDLQAQYDYSNTLKFHIGGFYHSNKKFSPRFSDQIGGYYDRKLFRDFWLNLGYTQWKGWNIPIPPTVAEDVNITTVPLGTTLERSGYKMADVSILYRVQLARHHYLRAGAGPSLCWGWNHNLEARYYDPRYPGEGAFTSVRERARYWGCTQQLSYDYTCFRDWLNIGVDLRARIYSGLPYQQYEYGFHAGVNF